MSQRIYKKQPLCLDYEGVHVAIPEDKIWMILLKPVDSGEPVRYLEFSPITRRPIVDCDPKKILNP